MNLLTERFPLFDILRHEFAGYSTSLFRTDILAGVTVAVVALPLALAFGIASGASAAAGLILAKIMFSGALTRLSSPLTATALLIFRPAPV